MDIVLKAVTILDPGSANHGQKLNITIEQGKITQISDQFNNDGNYEVVELDGKMVSPGWFDMNADFCDPGYEHKEDIYTGIKAAQAGGFTSVVLLPNTSPVIDTKNQIEYIKSKSGFSSVNVYPYAAITKKCEGEELTEMIDLHAAGAIAFTDGIKPIHNTDILLKTLQYLQKFNGLLINRPEDLQLNMFGVMHEGKVSTTLGLRGMPSIAEVIMIQRDLKILEYTGGKIHFSNVSTAESVQLIREAKSRGLKVTCDVAAHQLLIDENLIGEYDTNYKTNPPFRDEEDRKALIKGILDDTIDVIVSSHRPQDVESKHLEFDLADFGVTGLETLFPVFIKLGDSIPLEKLLSKITNGPREVLDQPIVKIEKGQNAELTIFDTELEWDYSEENSFSRSQNSPFFKNRLKGRAMGIINRNKAYFNKPIAE